MDYSQLKKDLEGLYITIPTLFNDPDMTINEDGIRQHISFLRSNGINRQNAVLLAGGAAGDFSTMSFDERVQVAKIVRLPPSSIFRAAPKNFRVSVIALGLTPPEPIGPPRDALL